jgi:hypothetical protein
MIYKFVEKEKNIINGKEIFISNSLATEMEVFKEDFIYNEEPRCCIKIYNKETDGLQFINITKKDLYHLIGALHCIQKEL